MKKRTFFGLFVTVATLLLTLPAAAAVHPFRDVPADAWYAEYVASAHDMGLINGKSDARYDPDGALTLAECIKLASCLHQLREDGEVTLRNGAVHWYDEYLAYALREEIVTEPVGELWEKVSRGRMAEIFARVLGDTASVVNHGTRHYADVWDESTSCYRAVYTLYRHGVMIGDGSGRFHPDAPITRAEVAAVAVRMADETARVRGEIAVRKEVTCPILMYHHFDPAGGDYTTTPDTFRSHLEMFRREGYTTVTFAELLRYRNGEDNLPMKPILPVSDDGYESVLTYALPLLREYGMKMSVAVIGEHIGVRGHGELTKFTLEEEAEADTEDRIELVSHTCGFHELTEETQGAVNLTLSAEAYEERFREDCRRMSEIGGEAHPMMKKVYVYPYGYHSEESERLLGECGYEISVTTAKGVARIQRGGSLRLLPRITAEWYGTGDALLKKLK